MTVEKGPEFSRTVALTDLAGGEIRIDAEAGERAALARRLGLVALDSLDATVRLVVKEGGDVVRLRGTLRADVTQSCVVTLEPVRSSVEVPFERHYSRAEGPGTPAAEDIAPDGEEAPSRWSATPSTWARPSPSNWLWRSTPFRDPRTPPSTGTSAARGTPGVRRSLRVPSRPSPNSWDRDEIRNSTAWRLPHPAILVKQSGPERRGRID